MHRSLTFLCSVLIACLFAMTAPEAVFAQKKTAKPKLDINNPDDALKADRKLNSSLKDGEPGVYWWYGNVYSRVPGEKDRLLFTYQAMNIRASKGFSDPQKGYGYRSVSREVLFYMDPQSGQILRTWKNPWTDKDVEVLHINNDPVNMRAPAYARGSERGDYKLRGKFKDGMYMHVSEVPLFYNNPLAGDYQDYVGGTYQAMEVFFTSCSEEELLDATKDKVENVVISWCRFSKWLPWMEMGDRVGQMIFTGTGKKIKSWDDLPDVVKDEIRQNYPAYASAPPLDDSRPNETSWTVFKKHMEKKKGN